MFIFLFYCYVCSRVFVIAFMDEDSQLKTTLNRIVLYAVKRMESTSDVKSRRSIFQEYKEWLGSSIDDWVLALPNNFDKSENKSD